MNFYGIIMGAISFLTIGIWHPIVVKGEYFLGKKICIFLFALIGTGCTVGSFFCPWNIVSTALALFGFSAFWGIGEVIHQEKRVKKGWFPVNPKREKLSKPESARSEQEKNN